MLTIGETEVGMRKNLDPATWWDDLSPMQIAHKQFVSSSEI